MAPSTILIVEDDPDTSDFFAKLLSWNGYETRVAANVSETIAAVKQHEPQGILLDYRLPGVDGLALCRMLRLIVQVSVPIVFLTGDYDTAMVTAALAAGVTEFLHKPVAPAVLLERFATLVKRQ